MWVIKRVNIRVSRVIIRKVIKVIRVIIRVIRVIWVLLTKAMAPWSPTLHEVKSRVNSDELETRASAKATVALFFRALLFRFNVPCKYHVNSV